MIQAVSARDSILDRNWPAVWPEIVAHCQTCPVGKRLPEALYVHLAALPALSCLLQACVQAACQIAESTQPLAEVTLVKFNFKTPTLSFLSYPDFDTDPHPALKASLRVDFATQTVSHRDYRNLANPFILHRKETFVTPDYPHYDRFAALTHQEEQLGLLDQPAYIGTHQGWRKRLTEHNVELAGHSVAPLASNSVQLSSTQPTFNLTEVRIDRHKAAISRNRLSKPMRLALEAGVITPETRIFDYGCGQGGDVDRLSHLGYTCAGWDPHYRSQSELTPAEVVNLGYVINVIESQAERRTALLNAWNLTQQVLIVAAQVLVAQGNSQIAYADGVITSRNTFQKYYDQDELKAYIDQVLGVDAIPVALGIYFIFRDEAQAQSFRASRFRSQVSTPRIQIPTRQFEDYRKLLTPLMDFVADRGRLPTPEELPDASAITTEFGTIRRAFQLVLQATNPQEWDEISDRRRQDLLVYLALSHFSHRPKLKELAPVVQQDIKSLFGSYQQACTAADLMLMSLGDLERIEERAQRSPLGHKRSRSLWVHVSAIENLDPLLRLYEGCASRTIGRLEEATVIKFHLRTPKITYLVVPNFDTNPHPAVYTSMQIDLRDLQVHYRDYDVADNPPILHQKELMVTPSYPNYAKFARLSRQEQDWGLLEDLDQVGSRQAWAARLAEHCAELRGHRLVWRKDVDAYQQKLVKARLRARQRDRAKDSHLYQESPYSPNRS